MDDIYSATNNVDDEYLISRHAEFYTYKTQLFWSGQLIDIVAQSHDRLDADGVSMFQNTALILSSLEHKNIVSFIGWSEDPYWIFIVTKYEAKRSLDKHLKKSRLSWMEKLRICVGVAHGLSYLHYEKGRDYSVIHCNIKSSSILLDDNWEPKICNFGHSIRTPVAQRHGLHHAKYSGTKGYMDALYEETKGVTQKSDVFSFGVLLFEVLFWWKAWIPEDDEESLVQSARSLYEEGKLDDMIDTEVLEEMDQKSFKIFSETAYTCLKEQRAQRPSMDQVVRQLEKALELQTKFENPEHSAAGESEDTSLDRLKGKDLEHLKIKLSEIEAATNDFDESYCIGSGGYGKVYKAKLHFEGKTSSTIEENNKGEFPKIRKNVAIKRIISRGDKQGEDGFFAEIEALASCKNRNIISLLGYCDKEDERILVYEHASNGSLDDYLGSTANRANLTWTQRLRICLGIARGLHYLHSSTDHKQKIIHGDIKSANILLDKNLEAKIADFGLSRLYHLNEESSTINTIHIAGTYEYWDPEYVNTGKLKKESDVYSLGVVLFEILCGKVAYDQVYKAEDDKGLGPIARRHYDKGTLKEMIDPILMQESDEILFTQNEGLNEDSLTTFSQIAYRCLAESQAKRPTMEVVVKELEQAWSFQENFRSTIKVSLKDIKLATQNFSENKIIGEEENWQLYRGELPHANGINVDIVIAKRFKDNTGFLEQEFVSEIVHLYEYKHKNIIGFVGYCKENDERIILYENASKGRLDGYLNDHKLTWMKRLKICIDVASGLDFLHGGNVTQEVVAHRNIRSTSILLDGEWKARIMDLGFSVVSSRDPEEVANIDHTSCTAFDPQFGRFGDQINTLTKESDIYSFGVVLFEILCGTSSIVEYSYQLGEFVRSHFPEGKLDEKVFEGIKEQIVPQSLAVFQEIVLQCLSYQREERPMAAQVLMQLKKALEFQEDHEMWEPKLPKDYKEIILMSKPPDVYSAAKKEDLYNMLFRGILLGKGKVWFSVGSNEDRNVMISARNFKYKNTWSRKWRPVPISRFDKVAKMLDISNLQIQVRVKPQLLSPGVHYGVYLVFRFCEPVKSVAKRMYVNLKYKKGRETLHTYFATWREDGWMMIELCRFDNHGEDTDFEFLLERFSRCYCESNDIYIEGIEFRVIENAKLEEIKELTEILELQKSDLNVDKVQQVPTNGEKYAEGEKLFSLNETNKKKHYKLSPKEALHGSSNVNLFNSIHSTGSRFQDVVELLRQQVFRIKCKIESQRLSPDTEYACYLVFKLSEKCCGLHCPVIVRDLLKRKNKEKGIVYFRSPSPCNVNDTDRVPKEREDGWIEVNVWQFNSSNNLQDNYVFINLKLICYEGTMSGLIVSGLEFRPM